MPACRATVMRLRQVVEERPGFADELGLDDALRDRRATHRPDMRQALRRRRSFLPPSAGVHENDQALECCHCAELG
jgi:hypothetical protein